MDRESLLKIAKSIVHGIRAHLGRDFTPPNIQELGNTVGQEAKRVTKLALLRSLTNVDPLDEVEMLTKIADVAKKVKKFKTGCCGELSMYVYNVARTIADCNPQILMMKASEGTDKHAFVLLGVATKLSSDTETSIADIAAAHPDAVVVDYWAVQNGYSSYQGAFPISVYDAETEDSLDNYDKTKVVRVKFT